MFDPTEKNLQPGKLVREARLAKQMTQEELAKKARLPLIAVIRVEQNGLGCCARHYIMLAQALHIPVYRFFITKENQTKVSDSIE